MRRGDRELRPLLGLAWDCGTLATGVVSVPVLLALGIGVMKTQKEKRKAAEEEEARKNGGQRRESEAASNALEGFGMITLARFSPVLLFAIQGGLWAQPPKLVATLSLLSPTRTRVVSDSDDNFDLAKWKWEFFCTLVIVCGGGGGAE